MFVLVRKILASNLYFIFLLFKLKKLRNKLNFLNFTILERIKPNRFYMKIIS